MARTNPSGADARGEQWGYAEVAAHLGISVETVRNYRSKDKARAARTGRRRLPEPDGHLSNSPWWWSSTITAYVRPGQGTRTDLRSSSPAAAGVDRS